MSPRPAPQAVGTHLRPGGRASARSPVMRRLDPQTKGKAGVLVNDLNPNGLGKAAGLQPKDVLLKIDGVACTNPDDAAGMLRGKTGKIVLEVKRGSESAAAGRFNLRSSIHALVGDL